MQVRIEIIPGKTMVGKRIKMSFTDNKTSELWRSFMPVRKEILNSISADLYSAEVYPPHYFENFNPAVEFDKWAAVEVSDLEIVPAGMETLLSPEGLYAVFIHKGPASEGARTYNYIFSQWLPNSGYVVDKRPHFGIMGTKYNNDSPDSEEEICIPVILK